MSDEAEWITYFPRGDNPVEMPTSGYVEFIDTWDDSVRHMMDMTYDTVERNLMWNRAAPRCVAKFRYISEKKFLKNRVEYYVRQNEKLVKQVQETRAAIDKDTARIAELGD